MKLFSADITRNSRLAKERYIEPFKNFFIVLGFYFGITYHLKYQSITLTSICLAASLFSIALPLVKKINGSLEFLANYLIFLMFISMFSVTIFTGGIKTSTIWWIGVVPVLAGFLLNSFYSIIWFIIVITSIILVAVLKDSSLLPASLVRPEELQAFLATSNITGISMLTMLGILADTVRENMSIEKEELLNQSFQLNKLVSLGKLSAGVSHEINNPLSVILGCEQKIARMIESEEEVDRAKLRKYMEMIARSVDRIEDVTSSLRTFNEKEGAGKIEILQIQNLILSIIDKLQQRLSENAITVNISEGKNKYYFKGVFQDIYLALSNIINNAIDELKHVKQSERMLSIDIDCENNNIIIKISDNGRGISSWDHNKIYDPFFTTKETGEGQGLGLTFALNVIKQNGGTLELDSPLYSTGATFKIILPLKTE